MVPGLAGSILRERKMTIKNFHINFLRVPNVACAWLRVEPPDKNEVYNTCDCRITLNVRAWHNLQVWIGCFAFSS